MKLIALIGHGRSKGAGSVQTVFPLLAGCSGPGRVESTRNAIDLRYQQNSMPEYAARKNCKNNIVIVVYHANSIYYCN